MEEDEPSTTKKPPPWRTLTLSYIKHHSDDFSSEPLGAKAKNLKNFKRICYKGEPQNYIQCDACKTIIRSSIHNRWTSKIDHDCFEFETDEKEELAILQLQCVNDNLSFINFDQTGGFGTLAQELIKIGGKMGKVDVKDILVNNEQLYSKIMPSVITYIKQRIRSILTNQKFALAINTWMNCTGITYYTVSAQTLGGDFKLQSIVLGTAVMPENPAHLRSKLSKILNEYMVSLDVAMEFVVMEDHPEMFSDVNWRNKITCPSYNVDMIIKELKNIANKNINKDDSTDSEESHQNFIVMFEKCSESLNQNSCSLSDIFLHKQKLESYCVCENDDSNILVYLKSTALHMLKTQFILHDFHKMAVFLNPNFKGLKFLNLMEKLEIHKLIKKYGIITEQNSQKVKTSTSSAGQFNDNSFIVNFVEMMDVNDSDDGQDLIDDEIMEYINLKMTSICTNTLEFWNKCNRFPKLKAIAQKVFTIPATSFPCGKIFIDGVKSRMRTCFLQDDIESMIFLNYNHEFYDTEPSFE